MKEKKKTYEWPKRRKTRRLGPFSSSETATRFLPLPALSFALVFNLLLWPFVVAIAAAAAAAVAVAVLVVGGTKERG
jgi:hypothetical protein